VRGKNRRSDAADKGGRKFPSVGGKEGRGGAAIIPYLDRGRKKGKARGEKEEGGRPSPPQGKKGKRKKKGKPYRAGKNLEKRKRTTLLRGEKGEKAHFAFQCWAPKRLKRRVDLTNCRTLGKKVLKGGGGKGEAASGGEKKKKND